MLEMPGGEVLLFERARVQVVDSTGAFVRQFGREGTGPGEFSEMTRVGRTSNRDIVWIWDARQTRVTSLNYQTGVLKDVPILLTVTENMGRRVSWTAPIAWDTGGQMISVGIRVSGPPFSGSADAELSETVLGGQPATEAVAAVIGSTRGAPKCIVQRGREYHDVPECRRQYWSINPAGSLIALAKPTEAQDRYTFTVLRRNGDTVYSLQHTLRGTSVDELVAAGLHDGYPSLPLEVTRPERLAEVRRLELGDDGSLWIAGVVIGGERTWHVLDPAGERYAQISLPDEEWVQNVTQRGALLSRDLEDGRAVLSRLTFKLAQ
jgi:hypothetical protein